MRSGELELLDLSLPTEFSADLSSSLEFMRFELRRVPMLSGDLMSYAPSLIRIS